MNDTIKSLLGNRLDAATNLMNNQHAYTAEESNAMALKILGEIMDVYDAERAKENT